MWQWFHQLGSPKYFYAITTKWLPWLGVLALMSLLVGIIWGLMFAPEDYQQGNSFRIFYVHVPVAILSQSCFVLMAIFSVITLVWQLKLADMLAKSAAPIGASLTLLALVTGALWGQPTWGTWWEWGDLRLTSVLILFFLYMGIIALRHSIRNAKVAAKATSVLTLVGVINIPIIKFSVEFTSTLHQGATLSITKGFSITPAMLMPFWFTLIGFVLFFAFALLLHVRVEILDRERRTQWVRGLVNVL